MAFRKNATVIPDGNTIFHSSIEHGKAGILSINFFLVRHERFFTTTAKVKFKRLASISRQNGNNPIILLILMVREVY